MTPRERFGRPLRLAMLGGGPGSWIGGIHRTAAELDCAWRVVAGVFAGDPDRSRAAGAAIGVDPARAYGDVGALIAGERARDDGVEAVAIMTPNDTHYAYAVAALDAGLDVIADKPVARTLAEALDLCARTRAAGRVFAITHGYSAYPMTRYARRLVREGAIGAPRFVQVEYIQSGMAVRLEDDPEVARRRWVLDPSRTGPSLVMDAIGCHAQHLVCSIAGARVARVQADLTPLMAGRTLGDHASALIELDNGARGTYTATQAAAGTENEIRVGVFGEKGHVQWSQRESTYLRVARQGEPLSLVGRGDRFLPPEIVALGRTPRGHPEGLREAFANIYREAAEAVIARALGVAAAAPEYPTIEDGAHTMAFVDACLESHRTRRWVDVAPTPTA
jgi:predicted dehydrogenase